MRTALPINSPVRAGKVIAHPVPSPTTTPHSSLPTAMTLRIARPQAMDRRQNARQYEPIANGASSVNRIFWESQSPASQACSKSRNSSTRGSGTAGAGNQNMLVASAMSVPAMPHPLRR